MCIRLCVGKSRTRGRPTMDCTSYNMYMISAVQPCALYECNTYYNNIFDVLSDDDELFMQYIRFCNKNIILLYNYKYTIYYYYTYRHNRGPFSSQPRGVCT